MIKKTTIAFGVAILLISCYASQAPAVNIGMSLAEFKNLAKYEELVAMDEDWTVYKVKYGYEFDRIGYYYFKNDQLVRMDSKEDPEEYNIKIDRR